MAKAFAVDAGENDSGTIVIASWGRRFIAWFVDYLIVNVLLAYFRLEDIESTVLPTFLLPRVPNVDLSLWSPLSVLIFFLYWAFSGWYFGRSIGQLLLNLRLVNLNGRGVSLRAAAIQSIGKSLLLPVDCLVAWIYRPCGRLRQRFFNKLSNTLVMYIGTPDRTISEGNYEKEPSVLGRNTCHNICHN